MTKKVHPEYVNPVIAREALRASKGEKQGGWSQYIIATFRHTGQVAPGCDARDFYAWFDEAQKRMEKTECP